MIDGRPLIHMTPPQGWINDPNGLYYNQLEQKYHMYYQYNPNDTVWDTPLYWGHATSDNLLTWDHHGVAISPDEDDHGIFSGSIVVDKNNTSGYFDDSIDPENRIVALYTLFGDNEKQTQEVAFSNDGGYTFEKYNKNPVIDVNSTQFRDPKVIWHEETQKWVMLLVKSQEYKVQTYVSDNLLDWEFGSNFTKEGYLGFQYECPGLFKTKIENPKEGCVDEKWVLVMAINPGSPIGGSINEYFVGDFDGVTFTPDDHATRFVDTGKDFYAFQAFDNTEDGRIIGVAWASNWQYAQRVPDDLGYRGSMSLVREYTLRYDYTNPETEQLLLVQRPVLDDQYLDVADELAVEAVDLNKTSNLKTNFDSENIGLLDFNITFTLTNNSLTFAEITNFDIKILSSIGDESIKIGFDGKVGEFYINRHTSHVFQRENNFFTERWSNYVEPLTRDTDNNKVYQVYGIVDKNILEVYFNNGAFTSTNTFFFERGIPANIEVTTDVDNSFVEINKLSIRKLGLA